MKAKKRLSYFFGSLFFLLQFYPAITRHLFQREVSDGGRLTTLISLGCCFLFVYFSSCQKKAKNIVYGIILVGILALLVQALVLP